MYYGIYKGIREGAWICLRDAGVDRLPIDIIKIARVAGVRVLRNTDVMLLGRGELGRSLYDGTNWVIVYDDLQSTETARYTVAHELGHILLGHEISHIKYSNYDQIDKRPKAEKQADMFACRLLCPACVIWALDLHTAEEIAEYCRVDMNVAVARSRRMKLLYERNMFLSSEVERQVFEHFREYIEKNTKNRLSQN